MNKRIVIMGIVLAAFSLCTVYFVQSGSPARRGGKDLMRLLPVLATLDANGDRVITAAELNAAPALLRKLDQDGDGKLTRAELRPSFQAQPRSLGAEVAELASEEVLSELLEMDEPNSWSRYLLRTVALTLLN